MSGGTDARAHSFTATLHAIRRTLALARTSPDQALTETQASILTELVPERHGRVCVRAVTRPSSPYPSRRNREGPISQHADYSVTIRPPAQAHHTPAEQARYQPNQANQPP